MTRVNGSVLMATRSAVQLRHLLVTHAHHMLDCLSMLSSLQALCIQMGTCMRECAPQNWDFDGNGYMKRRQARLVCQNH